MAEKPDPQQVLAEPGSYTVEQVTDVFASADRGLIEAAKEQERQGQRRKGVLEWDPPTPPDPEPQPPGEVRYGKVGWLERARGTFGRSTHTLAGALHDVKPEQQLSQGEVESAIATFDELVDPGTEPEEDAG